MSYSKMQTFWEVNEYGDLIHVGSGDPSWRTVQAGHEQFPLSAERVASLMNLAFGEGADAKLAQVQNLLGINKRY